MKPTLLVLGDIHLDRFIWRSHRQITGDAFLGFTSYVDRAVEFGCPILIAGDLFDTADPDSDLIKYCRLELDRAHEAGVEVYAIQGNHDKRPTPWYDAISPHCRHIGSGEPVMIGGLNVVAYDYCLRPEIEAKMAALTASAVRPDLLVLHQAARQALKFDGAWNFDLDWVPDGIPLVIMADIHKPLKMDMRNGGVAYYTGPGHARDIDQAGPKRCLAVTKTDGPTQVDEVPLASRSIGKWTFTRATDSKQGDEVLAWATKELTSSPLPPVCWLRHTEDQQTIIQDLKQRLAGLNVITVEDPMVFQTEDEAQEVDTSGLPSMQQLLDRLIGDKLGHEFEREFILGLIDPVGQPAVEIVRDSRDRFLAELHQHQPKVA